MPRYEHLYKVLNQYGSELHWFCKICQSGAEKLLATIMKMQTRFDTLEEEVVLTRENIRTEMAGNKKETEEKLSGNKHDISDVQTEMHMLISDVDAKVQALRDEFLTKDDNPKWADIVNQAVDSKLGKSFNWANHG